MADYILTLSFKGTAYCGWQVQKEPCGIQTVLQNGLEKTFKNRLPVIGCSRTDSGVHANEFVCLIKGGPDIPIKKIPLALNSYLPPDISVIKAEVAPEGFHPRYDAVAKEYIYLFHNSKIKNPFYADTALFYPRHIDYEKALEIAQGFVGKKDFRAFMAAGSKIIDTVRHIHYFFVERDGDFIRFRIAGDGFLYNMVRIMAGTVIQTLEGSISHHISDIIASKDRSLAGRTLPAHGLYLNRVFYDNTDILVL